MRGVFACNHYIDAQAPWALRKTDPERMHAVLRTLVRAIRMLAIAILPVVPDGGGARCSTSSAPAEARDHAAIDDDGWYDRTAAAAFASLRRAPVFPRLDCRRRRPDARRQPLPPQLQGPGRGAAGRVLARARARGVTAMLNIATRESEWDEVLATAEREPDVWATVGIHPHEADQHAARRHRQAGRPRRAPARRRHRRERPRLLLRPLRPRAAAGELPRAYRRRARDGPAAHRPHPRCRRRYRRDPGRRDGEGGLSRRHPLLHRQRRLRRQVRSISASTSRSRAS